MQELTEKAALLPRSIQWHFIGGLQTNKCAALAKIPNLFCVSSVDAVKKADALNKSRGQLVESAASNNDLPDHTTANNEMKGENDNDNKPKKQLGVHVQVNTSGEESKSGVAPTKTEELCRHILDACPHLRLRGLMTIGAIARSQATTMTTTEETENEDFIRLRDTRDSVADSLGLEWAALELSMGMSEDFEGAIRLGSDEVRVGSSIFGERPARKDAILKEDIQEAKEG